MAKVIIPIKIKNMMTKLKTKGVEVYIIGGAIRDFILGIEPQDYDLFTNATGEDILKIFPKGKVLGGEERQKKILTVIVNGVEISQFRSNGDRTKTGLSLEEHQATCDFTINSIACDINGNIIDTQKGLVDIKRNTIRFIGNHLNRVNEDPLRVLRGIRFKAKYNFLFESETEKVIMNTHKLVMKLPKERIREEFIKILKCDNPFEVLYNTNYMFYIIHKLSELRNIDGGTHHNETPFEHVWNAFNIAKTISDDWRIWLAALLHDIAKGETYSISVKDAQITKAPSIKFSDEEGYVECEIIFNDTPSVHFYRHDYYGAKYVEQWMREYKFAEKDINFVSTIVRMHMWGYKEECNKKTFTKKIQQLRDAGVSVYQFLMVCYCDHQGNMKKPRIKFGDFCNCSYLLKNYEEAIKENKPFKLTDLDIDGHLLMTLGFKNQEIGIELNRLFDLVCNGDIINRKDKLIEEIKNGKK